MYSVSSIKFKKTVFNIDNNKTFFLSRKSAFLKDCVMLKTYLLTFENLALPLH